MSFVIFLLLIAVDPARLQGCHYSPTTLRWKTFVAHFHIADGRNCLLFAARGLRILQAFTGFCRAKPLIFFVCSTRFRTHSLLVPGSNPGGPTNSPIYQCEAFPAHAR